MDGAPGCRKRRRPRPIAAVPARTTATTKTEKAAATPISSSVIFSRMRTVIRVQWMETRKIVALMAVMERMKTTPSPAKRPGSTSGIVTRRKVASVPAPRLCEASSMAGKLSPVGAEVDDQSMTLIRFADGKIGYVGASWTSPGIFAVRVFGSKGLMHYEIDFGTWDTPSELHKTSTLYIQRGKDGYAKREELTIPESDMFRAELEMFAESCRTGKANELTARNGNIAVAVVYAALRSIERNGQAVRIADVLAEAHARVAERSRHVA